VTDTVPRLTSDGGEAGQRQVAVDADSAVGVHSDLYDGDLQDGDLKDGDLQDGDLEDGDLQDSGGRGRALPDGGLGILVAGVLAFVAARPLADNSFLTHLATGRIILADGFPTTNPFLYSSTDFPVPSWLWSLVLGLVDAVGGGATIRVLTAVLAATLGLLVVRLTRPDGQPGRGSSAESAAGQRSLLSVALPAVCALVTLMPFLNGRPQLPGYLFLAVTVLVVKERRSPWWLLPTFAVWLNVHGTWMYGVAVLGLLLASQVIDDRRIRRIQLGCAVTAALGLLLGGVVGPEPFRLIGLPFEQFGDERARRAISSYVEWQPSGWGHPLTWMLVAMGLVAVFGAVRSRRWGALVGTVAMVVLGLSAGRLLPLAAITLVPWVSTGLVLLSTSDSMMIPDGPRARLVARAGAVIGLLSLLWIALTPAYDMSSYPVQAVDWLQGRGLAGSSDVRVASHDFVGNYLDWRFGERANTFVDDRAGVDAILDYAVLKDLDPGWRAALERTDADVIIWQSDEKLPAHLVQPDWYRAGDFGEFSVFCRSSIAERCS